MAVDTQRVDTSHRAYKGFDAKTGEPVGFDTAIDLHQAMVMGHVTLSRPGEPEPPNADPMRRYSQMSSEDLRKLCVARHVKAYLVMSRDQQIAALQSLDVDELERLRASAETPKRR